MTSEQIGQVARDYGTPAYIFDIPKLKERVEYLRSHLPEQVRLCYAIKANTFITEALNDCMPRFEVCSPGEYRVCQALNIPPEKLVISGVYKTPAFIRELVSTQPEIGVYTVESPAHLRLLQEAAKEQNTTLRVLLRLTSGNQFGLDKPVLREIITNRSQWDGLDILGIQYFSGTQKTSLKKLKRELERLDELIAALEAEDGFVCRELEYGPGFPAFYFQGEAFDEDSFLTEFAALLEGLNTSARITLELGRGIAACCGTYLTGVVDLKQNKGQNYAILDGGMNHLVYFGQSMAMKLPHCRVYPPRREGEEIWNLCGALCTANDILVKQLPVKDLQIGDVFAFENTGAYCMTEGISLFLSRALPQVLLLEEGGVFRSVRPITPTYPFNTPTNE